MVMIFVISAFMVPSAYADNSAVLEAKNGVVQVFSGIYYEDAQAYTYSSNGSYESGTAFGVGTAGKDTDIFIPTGMLLLTTTVRFTLRSIWLWTRPIWKKAITWLSAR